MLTVVQASSTHLPCSRLTGTPGPVKDTHPQRDYITGPRSHSWSAAEPGPGFKARGSSSSPSGVFSCLAAGDLLRGASSVDRNKQHAIPCTNADGHA